MAKQLHSWAFIPEKLKLVFHAKTCTQMFLVALFLIAPNWKQPRHPLAREWSKGLWCIHDKQYYSAIRRSKLLMYTQLGHISNGLC